MEYKKIAATIAGGGILAVFVWAGSVIYKASIHVDQNMPAVSGIKKTQDGLRGLLKKQERKVGKSTGDLTAAKEELDRIRFKILAREVHGRATRDIESARMESLVWVNTNSDARFFNLGEEVELITSSRTTTAKVAGTMFDSRERVLVKMNNVVATELDLTIRRGIKNDITIRRTEAEVERQLRRGAPF